MIIDVLNISKEKTTIKVLRMKKNQTKSIASEKKNSLSLVHVSDSMDELRQLSIKIVMLIKFSS